MMKARDRLRGVFAATAGEGGMVLFTAILVMVLFSLMGLTFLTLSYTENTIASNEATSAQAFGITEAGIEHARRELVTANVNAILASNPPLISFTAGGQNVPFAGGTYSVTVANNTTAIGAIPADPGGPTNDTDDVLVLTSTGSLGNATSLIETVVRKPVVFPPGARAAITTNGPTKTNGTLIIDGRDHDMNGNLVADTGTYGVFSASSYTQSGNSKVGGTDTGGGGPADHAPAKPGDPSVIEENYSGTMPTTPDEVMGYSAGDLMNMAQQHVNDPANLTYPLSGVTYVELPCGGTWSPANIDGSGVLVVHNSCGGGGTGDAVIKNLNMGTFKGLLIADDIVHIHTTIIGAVVSLTTGPSYGNVIGNGNGDVLYSRQALSNAMGGSQSYSILFWREVGS